MRIDVVGAGLAGSEAAWRLANEGVPVRLLEMKPQKFSPAHSYAGFAELVCSNSLKAMRLGSAAGLLKAEMERLGSLVVEAARASRVGAGGALAVDRERFSDTITAKLRAHPLIEVVPGEVNAIPGGEAVIATGPLTAGALARDIARFCGAPLAFYDAAAPVVYYDSIDMDRAFFAARYDRGDPDYINCPMDREEYRAFHAALTAAEPAALHTFDTAPDDGGGASADPVDTPARRVYEGCMPIEVLARRGEDSIRFGPLKPVGLRDPRTGRRPWAVAQLRRENAAGSLYNLVGFQTNLRHPEQKRVFSMIPGLGNARFARYGVMHRNTFLDSPKALSSALHLRDEPRVWFAGQITGVEGYIESAMTGIVCGINAARRARGEEPLTFPEDTMTGALCRYVAAEHEDFQPMGCNMGLLPPLGERVRGKQERYEALAARALRSFEAFAREKGLELCKPSPLEQIQIMEEPQ